MIFSGDFMLKPLQKMLMETDEILEERAKNHYVDLPYHNWENHILPVFDFAMHLCKRCEDYGYVIRVYTVKISAREHDTCYHENHEEKGFKTKEEYSAWVARNDIFSVGFPEHIAEYLAKDVEGCIIGTDPQKKLKTIEQMIVAAADLFNLSGDYEKFIENCNKL